MDASQFQPRHELGDLAGYGSDRANLSRYRDTYHHATRGMKLNGFAGRCDLRRESVGRTHDFDRYFSGLVRPQFEVVSLANGSGESSRR